MKYVKTIISILVFSLALSFNATAQKTQEQIKLIKTINDKIKEGALTKNHISSIRVWKKEFRILNKFGTTRSIVDIDKIKNVKIFKQDEYYSVKIVAPWGVTGQKNKNRFGSTHISASMKNKKLVKDIILDIKALIETYQSN